MIQKDLKAFEDPKDRKVSNNHKVTPAKREKKETKGLQDHRDQKVPRVTALVPRETKATKDQKVIRVTRDCRVPRVTSEIEDQKETKATKDQRETKVTKDRRDKQGPTGTRGIQGPKGDTGQRGPQGPAGTFGGTVATDVNMAGHKLYGLPTPTQDSEAATKKWVTDDFPTKNDILDGFTMLGPLDMGGHKIYEVRTPTNDKDAANKKYVDDHSDGTFKDGTTKTNQLDIRRVLSLIGIFEDVTFHSGAYSQDITSASPASAVINKNSLQNGGLIGLDSLVPTIKGLLSTLQEQKFETDISLLVLKGTVASHTIEHRDSSLVNNIVLRKVGNDTQLTIHFKKDLEHGIYSYEFDVSSDHTSGFDIYMYGECSGSGFRAHTLYRYWASDYLQGKDFNPVKQSNVHVNGQEVNEKDQDQTRKNKV